MPHSFDALEHFAIFASRDYLRRLAAHLAVHPLSLPYSP